MEKNEKMTPREWIENIWYHYKWVIIIGFVLIVFVAVSLAQFLSVDDPDIDILHIGPMYISPTVVDQIEETLADFAEDYNGDGEFHVNILDITVNKFGNEEAGIEPTNYDAYNKAVQRFQTEIRAGDSVIYMLDEEYFDICIKEGLLVPFEDIIDDAYMPENVISGCGVKISELDVYELPGLSSVPETAILCVRRLPKENELNYGREESDWESNVKTFVNLIKYRSSAEPEN